MRAFKAQKDHLYEMLLLDFTRYGHLHMLQNWG